MEATISEWLNLVVRWVHFVTGIMWIGSSIFFTWMNLHFEKPAAPKEGVEGELWMVHGGGFYVVEHRLVAGDALPKTLHWFKWEAMFTMLTGLFLLTLIFYMGGGVLMTDPASAQVSTTAAIGIGIGAIVVWWLFYDVLWRTRLAIEHALPATVFMFVVAAAISYGLTLVLSGRAAYMHTGAMLGVSMVLNVWVHIIPGQAKLVEATRQGQKPDIEQGKRGKRRSLHNHYMTYPVLFIMLSSHFPSTYGSEHAWLTLVVLAAVSVAIKHWQNKRDPEAHVLVWLLVAAALLALASPMIARALEPRSTTATMTAEPAGGRAIDAATTGRVRGVVRFEGTPPPPREVSLYGGCEKGHEGPVQLFSVEAEGGLLANAFVWVKSGAEGIAAPPASSEPVVVDQKRCLYEPRIVGARVGQPVTFVNSDSLFHNVRSVAEANETWSINMPAQDQRETKIFKKTEVMVQTRCDVHPWMIAYVGVVPHPWFDVTGADGAFALEGLPPGKYVVEVWHEALGRQEAAVELLPKGSAESSFTFREGGAP